MSEVFNRHGVQHHLYVDDKQANVNTPASNFHAARATLQAVSVMSVTGVLHADYNLTKLKPNSSGSVLRRSSPKFQKVS